MKCYCLLNFKLKPTCYGLVEAEEVAPLASQVTTFNTMSRRMSEIMLMLIKSDGEDEDENEEHVLVALDNDNYDCEYEDNDLRGSRLLVDPLGCSRLTPPPSCKSLASTRAPPPPSCNSLESSAISLPAALLDSRDSRVPGPAGVGIFRISNAEEN